LGTPFFTDSTIFSLRSNEYGFMPLHYPAQRHRTHCHLVALVRAGAKVKNGELIKGRSEQEKDAA
jgi:hypothetical protein